MATPSTLKFHCFVFAIIMAEAIWCGHQASAQTCNADISSLMLQCQKYVKKSGPKMAPSPGCCAAVKPIDVPCACAYVTKDVENLVSMEKVVFVARSYGVKLTPGTKCGSYTIPKIEEQQCLQNKRSEHGGGDSDGDSTLE